MSRGLNAPFVRPLAFILIAGLPALPVTEKAVLPLEAVKRNALIAAAAVTR